MNWVDVLSLAGWAGAALWGLRSGLILMWLPLSFLFAGMGVAGGLGYIIGSAILGFIDTESGQAAAGYFLILAAFLLLGAIVTRSISGPLKIVSLLWTLFPTGALINRAGGIVSGALFGCVLLSVIFIGLQYWPVSAIDRAIGESSFAQNPIGWVDRYMILPEILAGGPAD